MSTKITDTKAKQGGRGRTVFILLVISTILVVAALGAAFFSTTLFGPNNQLDQDVPAEEQVIDNKPVSPAIEDQSQQPDASSDTGENMLQTAPGGLTGQREPDLPGPDQFDESNTGQQAPTIAPEGAEASQSGAN